MKWLDETMNYETMKWLDFGPNHIKNEEKIKDEKYTLSKEWLVRKTTNVCNCMWNVSYRMI